MTAKGGLHGDMMLFDEIVEKMNPYHGKDGRFTTPGAAVSFTYKPGASTAHDKAIQRAKAGAKGFSGRLYHGSPNTDIETFDMDRAGRNTQSGEKLLFFTDSKQMADDFSYERLEGSTTFMQRRGKKGRVYEVDVEMKNPLDLRKLNEADLDNLLKLDVDGILTKDIARDLMGRNNQQLKTYLDLTAENLIELGYDGLIANTGKAGHNSVEYAVVSSKQAKIRKSAAMSFEDVLKANPYHDPKDGRFTTGPGGGGWAKTMADEKARVLAMKDNKRAMYVLDQDGESHDACVAAYKNGQTDALVNNYFAIMEANGDPSPTKPTSGQLSGKIRERVESGEFSDYDDARKAMMGEMTGMEGEELDNAHKTMQDYFGGASVMHPERLDSYIEKDHAYDGKIYRGMSFNGADYDAFMKNIAPGATISMKGNASWSSDQEVAAGFAHRGSNDVNSVMITCVKNRTSAPVDHLSHYGEGEVLAHSKAKWTVLHTETAHWPNGVSKTNITVIESGE